MNAFIQGIAEALGRLFEGANYVFVTFLNLLRDGFTWSFEQMDATAKTNVLGTVIVLIFVLVFFFAPIWGRLKVPHLGVFEPVRTVVQVLISWLGWAVVVVFIGGGLFRLFQPVIAKVNITF